MGLIGLIAFSYGPASPMLPDALRLHSIPYLCPNLASTKAPESSRIPTTVGAPDDPHTAPTVEKDRVIKIPYAP